MLGSLSITADLGVTLCVVFRVSPSVDSCVAEALVDAGPSACACAIAIASAMGTRDQAP